MNENATLEELEAAHAEVHRRLMPTITTYAERAAEVVDLQCKIFCRKLTDAFPGLVIEHQPKVMSIRGTENIQALKAAAAALAEKQVEVKRVIFDPVRHEFNIFA